MRTIFRYLILAFVAGVVIAAGGYIYLERWADQPMNVNGEAQKIIVAPGSTFYRLASAVERNGWIDDSRVFRVFAKVNGRGHMIQAGEYQVDEAMTPRELIAKVEAGDVIEYSITLVNGHTYQQFLRALHDDDVLIQTLDQSAPEELMSRLGSEYSHPEGWFYPDTYRYERGATDFDILQRAHRRMKVLLHTAWETRVEDLPYANPYEALIMASIVEKETAVAEEREIIAGVFVNRLRKNMRLQTDPTVIYGLGDEYKGNITRKHLRTYSSYNTYRINGLPPTPIANPALPAIKAALHPASVKALYFVARGDGSHYFSTTLEEHMKAVKRYQLERRSDYRSTPKK